MKTRNSVGSLIHDFLNQKRDRLGSYSIRAFARDLELSPSFVSRAMSGQKTFSLTHLKKIFKVLDIDKETQIQLKNRLLKEKIGEEDFKHLMKDFATDSHLKFKKLSRKKLSVLSEWYHIAVLEVFTVGKFQDTPRTLALKLGISTLQAEQSLELLVKLKILKLENGVYAREETRIRLASSASRPEIRAYHQAMISKAQTEMRKIDEVSFGLRLITGITLGANPEKLDEAKALLNDAIHRASEILGSQPCSQVYQINLQLFPLTKK